MIKLMIAELANIIDVTITQDSETRFLFQAGNIPVLLDYRAEDDSITINAAFCKIENQLPAAIYELILNANACGAQLDGAKIALDKQSQQLVIVKLLQDEIQSGEALARVVVELFKVVAFWQTVLVNANLKKSAIGFTNVACEDTQMLSV